jgi:ABC-type Fe3+-hydroxamate transport system substrate-binding protein
MLHEMLELAGAENAFHEGTERKHVTQAAVVAAAPDLVLDATGATPSDPLGLPDALEIRRVPPGWSELPALDPLTRIRGLHALLYPEDATP